MKKITKIGSELRNLLIGQAETIMLSRNKCWYKGEIYVFDELTGDEVEIMRLKLIKSLDRKSYLKTLLSKLIKK